MRYGRINGIDKPVSRLVLGATNLSSKRLDESMALLDAALTAGCTCIDTAHIYGGGDCDRVLGQWLTSRGVRDQVVILGKGAHHNQDRRRVTPFDIASDLHDSLARLKSEYIDLYLLHRDDPSLPVGPIVEALDEQRAAGRIRAFGGSNWTHERIEQANEYAAAHGPTPFAASSPNLSLMRIVSEPWAGYVSICGPEGAAARQWYRKLGMPVFAWSSLGSGMLSGQYDRQKIAAMEKPDFRVRCFGGEDNLARLDRATQLGRELGLSPPQVGAAYLLNQPLEVYPLVGCRSGDEYAQLAAACEVKLSAAQLAWLETGQ